MTEREYELAMARARFKDLSVCLKCDSIGVVRVGIADVASLALCSCDDGVALKNIWALPMISEPFLREAKIQPLPRREFLPPVRPKSQRQVTRFVDAKISWFKEKINIAIEFWKNFNIEHETTRESD